MTLREVTRTVIKRVEDASGCSVVVSEDASLKTLAASRIARGANKIHLISFNPSTVSEPDYLICFQCGFILRLFSIPAADRFDLVGTVEALTINWRGNGSEKAQTGHKIKKIYRESFPKPLVEIAVEKGEIGDGACLDAN